MEYSIIISTGSATSTIPQGLLVWDTVADGFIDYLDYADNLATFEGAFATNYRYIIADNNNSAIGVASIDGSIEYIDYDAWGEPSYTGDIDSLNILWNGYYFDGETGNYYLRNRYYSPTEHRFLTEDPHGTIPDENWNNPFGITNQYTDGYGLDVYAGFNPITGRDDWGLVCGSKGNDWIVHDRPFPVNFTIPCYKHDKCYEGWGKFGDRCRKTKKDCDDDFFDNMNQQCDKLKDSNGRGYYQCLTYAKRYHEAVQNSRKAQQSFDKARKKHCCGR